MDKYIERAINEHSELVSKIVKLGNFIQNIESGEIKNISVKDVVLMNMQYSYMNNYVTILEQRLNLHGIVIEIHNGEISYNETNIEQ